MKNKKGQQQDKKRPTPQRKIDGNKYREVSQSQLHFWQTPRPHLSSAMLSPWCRFLVKGTSLSSHCPGDVEVRK